MKTYFITDIHGHYKEFKDCLESVNFNPNIDCLICGGDILDGGNGGEKVIENLINFNNVILLKSNHDFEAIRHNFGIGIDEKLRNKWFDKMSAKSTYESYKNKSDEYIKSHLEFLKNSKYYYILDNKLFVHAGIRLDGDLDRTVLEEFIWSFDFSNKVLYSKNNIKFPNGIDEIYIGHSATNFMVGGGTDIVKIEMSFGKFVYFCDTGCSLGGKLSIIEILTNS